MLFKKPLKCSLCCFGMVDQEFELFNFDLDAIEISVHGHVLALPMAPVAHAVVQGPFKIFLGMQREANSIPATLQGDEAAKVRELCEQSLSVVAHGAFDRVDGRLELCRCVNEDSAVLRSESMELLAIIGCCDSREHHDDRDAVPLATVEHCARMREMAHLLHQRLLAIDPYGKRRWGRQGVLVHVDEKHDGIRKQHRSKLELCRQLVGGQELYSPSPIPEAGYFQAGFFATYNDELHKNY